MADEQPIPSAWTRPRRKKEQALSQEQIVAEAVRLLDAEGVEALTMRRLGTQMGTAATSLYRHVTNRDELIELVVDEVYGEIEVPAPASAQDWRAGVTACAHSVRSMILRHPWIASVLGQVGLSYLGPNVMRLNDRMLGLFASGGFGMVEADQAISAVMAYVIGIGISEAALLTVIARSGQDEQDWEKRLRPTVEQATRPYPHLREHFTAHGDKDLRQVREDHFAYGLGLFLDGLETRRS
ncbi:TetR/AcrR family transcriptional regulator [Allokutzneria oryzae]|uniref:TetR/AcrR family transcriptional regulator n=1 Tax=Allokutzneria oryzae TaxID=1378989 RepID=A0ABV5ZUX1_9PSEU